MEWIRGRVNSAHKTQPPPPRTPPPHGQRADERQLSPNKPSIKRALASTHTHSTACINAVNVDGGATLGRRRDVIPLAPNEPICCCCAYSGDGWLCWLCWEINCRCRLGAHDRSTNSTDRACLRLIVPIGQSKVWAKFVKSGHSNYCGVGVGVRSISLPEGGSQPTRGPAQKQQQDENDDAMQLLCGGEWANESLGFSFHNIQPKLVVGKVSQNPTSRSRLQ